MSWVVRPAALALVWLLIVPAVAAAEGGAPSEDTESAGQDPSAGSADVPATPASSPVDDLDRPFPDPALVRMGRSWTAGGAVLTATGAALVIGGMVLGSSVARGEVSSDPTSRGFLVGALVGGAVLAGVGLPTLSAGTFTTRQLLRTIRGAEKVPRTVANEKTYWLAYRSGQYGQTLAIAGGAAVVLGVVTIAAVTATVGTDYYDPLYWLAPAAQFGGGAAMIVGGLLWKRDSERRLEAIRDAVDPYRRERSKAAGASTSMRPTPVAHIPRLSLAVLPGAVEPLAGSVRLSWGLDF